MSPDVPEMIDGWTLYVCPNGHVATSTLNLACWACYPGGRDALPTQKPVEVVPRSALDRRTREIVEALRAADDGGDGYGSGDWAAVLIERTFLSPDNPEGKA